MDNGEPDRAPETYSERPTGRKKHRRPKYESPQQTVNKFWDIFTTNFPGRVDRILPDNVYAKSKAATEPKGVVHGQAALKSYEETKAECIRAVDKIAKECRRVNMRYRDPHFDIEFDLKQNKNDCLQGLVSGNSAPLLPQSVKRVNDIFEDPQFTVDDATASDVRQGNDGDCWFLSALCAIGNKKGLIDRVCVAKDELVGVYGFVFHRDGEWTYTVIDDKLYLNSSDYNESQLEKFSWDQVFNRQDAEEEYRKAFQTGSRALYFAQCSNEHETWLPLLEKAFAKAHGDYEAINGGFTGEAIEDLTGGVTTELFTTDILDKEKFWKDELLKVNDEFLFGCATGCFDDWKGGAQQTDRKGVVAMHAYSIMEAREVNGERLVKIRNPWGKMEWQGAWSDGSSEWTPEWMQLLNHRFGNDGIFWISYKDLLRRYQSFDRTRLFGDDWTVTQQWTTVDVPWTADYNDTKFVIKLEKKGPIVIVLSQLDDRYFRGLQGQYDFSLHFRLDKYGEDDYIVRSHGNYLMNRSVSTDLELEPGVYSVLMKITARRFSSLAKPEEVLRYSCKVRQEKLLQIGLAYDLAHARGQVKETEDEKERKAELKEKARAAARQQQREEFTKFKYKKWQIFQRTKERNKRHQARLEEHQRKKAEAAAAERRLQVERDYKEFILAQEAEPRTIAQDTPQAASSQLGEIATPSQTPIGRTPETIPEESTTGEQPPATVSLPSPPAENAEPPLTLSRNRPSQNHTAQDKIDEFNNDLSAIPSARINSTPADGAPPPASMGAPPTTASVSDADTLSSFDDSVDSLLDLDSLPDSSGAPPDAEPTPGRKYASDEEDESEDENAEFAADPWNAVCVVGLRVFSKDKGVTVAVVRPKVGNEEGETKLDVDDPSKGVAEEGPVGEGEGEGEGVEVVEGLEKELQEGRVEGV
ncbi:hypothetical protein MMC26_001150 [Xylographa opegraphella]|nr:hypothetical protein [Xylographa opegraphella]